MYSCFDLYALTGWPSALHCAMPPSMSLLYEHCWHTIIPEISRLPSAWKIVDSCSSPKKHSTFEQYAVGRFLPDPSQK